MIGKSYGELFTWSFEEHNTTVMGVYLEETSAGIGDFLAADSGDYLDQFIAAKLKAGRAGVNEGQKLKCVLIRRRTMS